MFPAQEIAGTVRSAETEPAVACDPQAATPDSGAVATVGPGAEAAAGLTTICRLRVELAVAVDAVTVTV